MLDNQDLASKPCPVCRVGRVYTGDNQSLNGKMSDGRQACPTCVTHDIINRFMNERAK